MISESILTGAKVRLRPPAESDLPLFVRWLNDPDVRFWLSISEDAELTLESEREWLEEMRDDPERVCWTIETPEGWPAGNVDLREIDETHGRATLGIFIGEKEYWNRGLGSEALRRVLGYAFGELDLRRVQLLVDEDNGRAIRCYEKCGFVQEGLLRAYRFRRGRLINVLVMAVLRDEYSME